MANISLNLLVIRSADIDRAAAFYALLGIGFEKHRHGSGPVHYAAELGEAIFEIYPRKSEKDSTDAVRLGFRVASVEGAVATVREAGGRIVSTPQYSEWGLRAVVDDPDGHRIELTETQGPEDGI